MHWGNHGIMNAFLDDGFCHDQFNYGDCMFDGLDCCGYDGNDDGDYHDYHDFAPGDTALCTECLCKGMYRYKKQFICHKRCNLLHGFFQNYCNAIIC